MQLVQTASRVALRAPSVTGARRISAGALASGRIDQRPATADAHPTTAAPSALAAYVVALGAIRDVADAGPRSFR